MRTIICGVLLASLAGHPAWAQGKGGKGGKPAQPAPAESEIEASAEALSLAEVFQVAVRVAPALEHAAYDVASAEARLTGSKGAEDFVITATGDVSRTKGAPSGTPPQGSRFDSARATLSIRRLLPTNGTLELIGASGRTTNEGPDFTTPMDATDTVVTDTYETSVKLRLTQPLLKGFGPAAVDRNTEVAKHGRNATVIRRSATARSFAAQLVEAYWRLALAWRELEVSRASLAAVSKQLTGIERAVRTGALARSELLPIETAIAGRQQDILTAELGVLSRSIELRKLAGLEINPDSLAIRTAELPEPDTVELEVKAYVARAIETSDELKAAVEDSRGSQAQLAGSRRDLLPRLDLRVEGGPVGAGAFLSQSTERFGKATGYTVNANLTFELPVGRHGVRGTYDADRYAALRFAHEVHDTRATVAAEVARTVYQAKQSRLAISLGEKAVKLAVASVEAEEKKFDLGKSTTTEIVRKQEELNTARLRHASSVAEYVIARAQLDAATGTILGSYGITIGDYREAIASDR
jgi:outer membrane protein